MGYTARKLQKMPPIEQIIKALGFDPKTHPPGPCWPWPGTIVRIRNRPWQSNGGTVPAIKLRNKSTINPIRTLVEYVNDTPFPRHPMTGNVLHRIRRCELHPFCVNPWHAHVEPLRNHGYPEVVDYPHHWTARA